MATTIDQLKSLFQKAKKKTLDATTIDEKLGQGLRSVARSAPVQSLVRSTASMVSPIATPMIAANSYLKYRTSPTVVAQAQQNKVQFQKQLDYGKQNTYAPTFVPLVQQVSAKFPQIPNTVEKTARFIPDKIGSMVGLKPQDNLASNLLGGFARGAVEVLPETISGNQKRMDAFQGKFTNLTPQEKTAMQNENTGMAAGLLAGLKAKGFKPGMTGQFSNLMDKKVRFEIDDSGAKLKQGWSKNLTNAFDPSISVDKLGKKLSDILDHPQFFKQYPEMSNVKVVSGFQKGAEASFDPKTNTIIFDESFLTNRDKLKTLPSTLLHEIQHAIQQKEGFASGGSPRMFELGQGGISQNKKMIDEAKKLQDIYNRTLNDKKELALSARLAGFDDVAKYEKDLLSKLYKLSDDIDKLSNYKISPIDAQKAYKSLAGEIESRAVQRRMDMPQSQRLTTDPYQAEMTATGLTRPQDAIVRFDETLSELSTKGKMRFKPKQALTKEEIIVVDQIITNWNRTKDLSAPDAAFIDRVLTGKAGATLNQLDQLTPAQRMNELGKFANVSERANGVSLSVNPSAKVGGEAPKSFESNYKNNIDSLIARSVERGDTPEAIFKMVVDEKRGTSFKYQDIENRIARITNDFSQATAPVKATETTQRIPIKSPVDIQNLDQGRAVPLQDQGLVPIKKAEVVKQPVQPVNTQPIPARTNFSRASLLDPNTSTVKAGQGNPILESLGVDQTVAKNLDKPSPTLAEPLQKVSKLATQNDPQLNTAIGKSETKLKPLVNQAQPYFNTNNLKVTKKAKTFVDKTVKEIKPQIEAVVGKKLSNKEAVDRANMTASTLGRVVTKEETLAWEAKMLKARQLLAQQAKDGKVTPEYLDNLMAVKSQGSDIARKLQSLSIGADPAEVTAKQMILELVMKVTDDANAILEKAQGVDFNDFKAATAFYRQFVKPGRGEWMDLLRYNSMLSSPNTHINNAFSNFQGVGIIAPIEKTVEGSMDAVRAAITGTPRRIFAGEGVQYAKGYYSSVKTAAEQFTSVMRGRSMLKNPDVRSIPLATSGAGSVIEKVLSVPLKLLEASDQFFTALTEGGAKSSLQYRSGKLGTAGKNIDSMAANEAAKRLFRSELGDNKGSAVLNAIDSVANLVQAAKNSDSKIVSNIAKFTLPFLRTPTNILKQGVEYSPLGVTTLIGATNKQQQLARAIMGSSIGLGTAMLLSGDRMTWAEPVSEKQRNAFKAAGLQPYSVKIGDKWVSYSKLHPAISFNLALVAGVRDALDKKTIDESQAETILTGLAKWMNFYADQSYLKNIGDMVATTKGDASGVMRTLSNYPQQLIPFRALMSWVERIVDPVQRQVDPDGGLLEKQLLQIATQIPGLAGNVPVRLDSQGNAIPNQNRFLNAVSPVKITTENPNAKTIYKTMVTKAKTAKEVEAVKTRVLDTGKEEVYKGKKYYSSFEVNSKTGEKTPVVKSIDVPQTQEEKYNDLTKEYQSEDDSPKNLLSKVAVYGVGMFADPKGTLDAIKSGQPVRKVRGDAVIVERMKNLGSLDAGDKNTQVDHVIPLALGGTNDESNLQVISSQDNQAKGIVDTYLAKELEAGRITKKVAQERDLNWRAEIATLPANEKAKAQAILAKVPVVNSKEATKDQTSMLEELGNREYEPILNNETGNYSDVQVNIPEYPKLTGLAEADKKLKSSYYSALTTAKKNIEKLYLAGQITAEEFNSALIATNTAQKKAKSGKKAKKIKIGSTPTLKKISVKAPQVAQMAKIDFKIPTAQKVPIRKASTSKPRIKLKDAGRRLLSVVR